MRKIEFLGIARSGKTTVAKYLEKNFNNVKYYPERHDLVPKEIFGDNFKHNLWYAKYCLEILNSISDNQTIHIFERGIIDRMVIGRVYYKMGWFTNKQLKQYEELLSPHINKIDKVFVFLIPVSESVKRAHETGKDVRKAIPYMNNLYIAYKDLNKWVSGCVYLPQNAAQEEIGNFIAKDIGLIE